MSRTVYAEWLMGPSHCIDGTEGGVYQGCIVCLLTVSMPLSHCIDGVSSFVSMALDDLIYAISVFYWPNSPSRDRSPWLARPLRIPYRIVEGRSPDEYYFEHSS